MLTVITEEVFFSASIEHTDGTRKLVRPEELNKYTEADGWKVIVPPARIVVSQENWHIGTRLTRLEDEARSLPPHEDPNAQIFRVALYPQLAAAIVEGEVPTEEQALNMPTPELNRWFEAVKRQNTHWFETPEEESDEDKKKEVN